MSDLSVAVLGCGPAGLIAAHAVALSNKATRIEVFSRRRKSPLYGAQYLHAPIPGIDAGESITVDYTLMGTPEGYRRKVYGNFWQGDVSPSVLSDPHKAWDIRGTYDRLWGEYHGLINDININPIDVHEISQGFDLVINSIPLPSICHGAHKFDAQTVIAAGDAPGLGVDVGAMYKCPESTVICNGDEEIAWYRKSRIFGHTTIEWPESIQRVPVSTAASVQKPLYTNCDCWPDMLRVGRYGRWKKGVLSHTAFSNTALRLLGEYAS